MYSLVPSIQMDEVSSQQTANNNTTTANNHQLTAANNCNHPNDRQTESQQHAPPPARLDRRFSVEAPSTASMSSKNSSLHIRQRRHDRRKERLNTELLIAVMNSSFSEVIGLLENGASPNATCRPNRVSAVHISAMKGDCLTLGYLLSNGANSFARDRSGRQAIHYAAWTGEVEAVQLLVQYEPSLVNSPVLPDDEPIHDMECLDSWNHDHDRLNHLVPDAVDLKSTPLHLACKTVNFETVDLLLNYGADVASKDDKGLTPLDVTGLNAPPNQRDEQAAGVVKKSGSGGGEDLLLRMSGEPVPPPEPAYIRVRQFRKIDEEDDDEKPLPDSVSNDNDPKIRPRFGVTERRDEDGGGGGEGEAVPENYSLEPIPALPPRPYFVPIAARGFQRDGRLKNIKKVDINDEKPSHKIVCSLIRKGAKMPKGNVILKEGAVINQNKMTVTTLHTAVVNEELELIQCLLQNGACLMTWNEDGDTPIHLAVKKWLTEPLKKMLSWDGGGEDGGCHSGRNFPIVDVRDSQGRTPLHLAVKQEWPNGVALLLEAGANVTATSNDSETVLHMASESGNKAMLAELLSMPDTSKSLEYRNNYYHTPLCRAVENGHLSCVELLCESGSDSTIATPGDVTLLHMAASKNYPDILGYLVTRDAGRMKDVRCGEVRGGMTPLHIAAREGYTKCVQELLKAGCDVLLQSHSETDRHGTALHLAAKEGHLETIKAIVKHDSATLESTNHDCWHPLHIAAGFGRSDCVRFMLKSGADISATVWDGTERKTALDLIMYCVPQPVDLLEKILDSYMKVNDHPLNDPDCEIQLQYDILAPGGRACKQLKVLNAILNNGNQNLQERLLLHPLIETFLFFKWRKLRIFFSFVMILHVILTLCLTILAHLAYVDKGTSTIVFICSEGARLGLFFALVPIIIVEVINASQLQRYYINDCESWVKWAVVITSSIVGIADPQLGWPRHIAAIAVLLAWIELLFLLARYPKWGFYVLMFSRVASNVFKVLATFTFLVLGFTFAFLIHFEAGVPFRNLLEAFIKVIVMMLEFDYENMFEQVTELNAFSVIGRILFVLFVVLVAMVMMNLMVGLAVSDITLLETQGKTQRLAKQTAFLSLLELTVYNERLHKLLPKMCHKRLQGRRSVPSMIIIKPASSIGEQHHILPKCLKDSVLDRVWSSHKGGDEIELSISLHDINDKIDHLAGIVHDKLTDASSSSSSSSSSISGTKSTAATTNSLSALRRHHFDLATVLQEILEEMGQMKNQLQQLQQQGGIGATNGGDDGTASTASASSAATFTPLINFSPPTSSLGQRPRYV